MYKKLEFNESLCPSRYSFQQYDDQVSYFNSKNSPMLIPDITSCIQVDSELHMKPFQKGCSILLPQCFRHSQGCNISMKTTLENSLYTWNRLLKTFLLYLTNYRNIFSQSNMFTQPKL